MDKNNLLVKAVNKNVRSSPRKLSLVCNFIKGKKADIALRDLEFTRKRIAKDVSKTGKTSGGRSPVSPWGQSAKGLKTRKPKRSDKLIINRRKKRKI